ncbi:hypothetical protein GOP47_0009290 [Adiantum capillus-veneris]|uniref:NADH dehydrogenase [ubiquinone] 1 alpha subcomplex assembly factor 3 n=1 Tax=Adiantum capillus-veneris TaxID=13818 RepID=A0A9D4UWB6_ADICA|nr:hypothetical protein GOP47_0009290 [Adiantum capillus-veneris]
MWRFQGLVRQQAALANGAVGKRWISLYEQMKMMDKLAEESGRLRFTGYNDTGFHINNVFHEGSVMCHRNLILSWTPRTFKEITPESLSIFQLLRPAPDLLLVGCGRSVQFFGKEVEDFLDSNKIKLEAIDSRNAASTFNFLNDEGRSVAAAIIPCSSEA